MGEYKQLKILNYIKWLFFISIGFYLAFLVATRFEEPPVYYKFPFKVVEREYFPGDDLLVKVHFCLREENIYYRSITQTFVNLETGEIFFTNPVLEITVSKSSIGEHARFYTDEDGSSCYDAFGAPKRIPSNVPPGEYELHFVAIVKGKWKKDHTIEYKTLPFQIQ